jgi:hypothetical protein
MPRCLEKRESEGGEKEKEKKKSEIKHPTGASVA